MCHYGPNDKQYRKHPPCHKPWREQEILSPKTGDRPKIGAQLCPRAVLDFLKALVKRGRACSNSISSRKADGVNTHQVRTKTTYRASTKKVRRKGVVRCCSCAIKSMVLGLEGCLVGCTYGSNKTQHRNRINLEVTQSLNQALGRCIDFQHSLDDFLGADKR